MKKIVIFMFGLFLMSNIYGQIELRLLAGAYNGTFDGQIDNVNLRDVDGYQFGADLQLGNQWYFQTGLRWDVLQQSFQDQDGIETIGALKARQLRAPLYIGHRFMNRNAWINLRVFAGPNISLVTSRSLKETFNWEDQDFKDLNLGVDAGFGLDIMFLYLDVGYMFGLGDEVLGMGSNEANQLFFINGGLRIKF